MKRLCPLFVILVVACGMYHAIAASLPEMASVPLLACGGLPCVDATVSGKHLKLLIDTGNVASTIDRAFAAGQDRAVLPDVRLGGASLGDVRTLALDIRAFVQKNEMPEADGTLAYTAFKDRVVELDYRTHQLRVSAPLTVPVTCPGKCGTVQYITFGKQGPPIVVVSGFTINSKAVSAQLDTLFSGAMLIYPNAVDGLGLKTISASTQKRRFPYTDGGVDMIEAVAKLEGFQGTTLSHNMPVYFVTPGVHAPDGLFDATVGIELLSHCKVTINFHDNWITIST